MMQEKSTCKFYVYKITNKINKKVYIGKSNTNRNRWASHKDIAKNKYKNTYHYLHKSINKYNVINFIFEIIEYFDDENDAYNAESKYIKLYKSNNSKFGMNLNTGGNRSFSQNKEVGKKISASKIGFKFSEESKEKMRISHLTQRPSQDKCNFTDEQVIQLRRDHHVMKIYKEKNIINKLIKKYNASASSITFAINGKNYKHIPIENLKPLPDNMKVCSKCSKMKVKSDFSNCKRNIDGLCCRCRKCDGEAGKEYKLKKKNK